MWPLLVAGSSSTPLNLIKEMVNMVNLFKAHTINEIIFLQSSQLVNIENNT